MRPAARQSVIAPLRQAARALLVAVVLAGPAAAQPLGEGDLAAEQALGPAAGGRVQPAGAQDEASAPILTLFLRAGWLMAPIVGMSVVVAAVAIERGLGLRPSRVIPRTLERGLRQMAELGDFEPGPAHQMCQDHPSALARVVTATVAGAGRPHAEVVAGAGEAVQREADRMYARVRTLNLAAAVTPLMGLLGTVWGMIAAFFATATLPLGSNKGQVLAEGIYVALVTTFAGLAVAIPAAVLAHYFEGRILRLTRSLEELLGLLLPRIERFEGGPRFDPTRSTTEEPSLRAISGEAGSPPPPLGPPPPHGDAEWAHDATR